MRRLQLIVVLVLLAVAAGVSWLLLHVPVDGGEPSPWIRIMLWIMDSQRAFHRDMAGQLRGIDRIGWPAAWGLVSLSFLYGIFHAAGPGHGKAVIATYLATNGVQVRRGMALAAGASLCQGLVAIVVVHGVVLLAGWLPVGANQAVGWTERASFVFLAVLGAVFAARAGVDLLVALKPRDVRATGSQDHFHVHGPDCGCAHGPSPEQTARATDWHGIVAVLLAIGLRPCSGAVLVLALANVLNLEGWGIGAVVAMSLGTAITVAALALLVVKARRWASVMMTARLGGMAWVGRGMALVGGLLILLMGISLLMASFGPANPLLF